MSKGIIKKLTIEQMKILGKRVLMRVDFNVPMSEGIIQNNHRIVATLKSIKYALDKEARSVILMSHLGRPRGHRDELLSLRPVAYELEKLLETDVKFLPDCVGSYIEGTCNGAPDGSVILLENLRFHPEEEGVSVDKATKKKVKLGPEPVRAFRQSLSRLADIYVNDAFGTAHRAHSSILAEGYDQKGAGFLLQREIEILSEVINAPKRPSLAILGGSKVVDKIPLIKNIIQNVDEVIIGGGMAYTFVNELYSVDIGNSKFDKEGAKLVWSIMEVAESRNVKVHLPIDFVAGNKAPGDNPEIKVFKVREGGIPAGWSGYDIGPETREAFLEPIDRSNTIIWNGPLGVFEEDIFAEGTKFVMNAVVEATEEREVISILGGGDVVTAAKKFNYTDGVTHISSGGGASLTLLSGEKLPGIEALSDI